ncbi:MAG TPA: OmpA family protein [Chryseosolibacter sp.]|nr:OmpA family protein [Chryseosolibacter sp.]
MKYPVLICLFLFCSTTLFAQKVSSRYELVKMDKTVNTFHHEAAPVVSADGKTLYFFVQDHPDNTMGNDDTQDIWMSERSDDGSWGQAQHLGSPFNIHHSNQVFAILSDGSLFIRGGKSKGEKGFSIAKAGGGLRELEVTDFKKMNKGRFYGATMSDDLKHIIMYFSEKDNSQNSDIYISHLQPDGSYSAPAMIKTLSSSGDDVGPFIGPDQKTLYYGSARQAPGKLGGVDIYSSTRLDDSWNNWSEPVNVGKPINTSGLDYYFTMDAQGNVYTSRAIKALEGANLDLYKLVPKTMHINLEGVVLNEKTNESIGGANVTLNVPDMEPQAFKSASDGVFSTTFDEVEQFKINANAEGFLAREISFSVPLLYSDTTLHAEIVLTPIARELIIVGSTLDEKTQQPVTAKLDFKLRGNSQASLKGQSPEGKYEQTVPELGWYIISASAEGYLNTTDSVELVSDEVTPVLKDLYLRPIEVGVTVRLKNIYFDFDKTTLKPESFIELDKVVDFLQQNKSVEIEIAGHTDNKGSDEYNENLSQGRSQSVVDYIISKGVEEFRLKAHGYGESRPLDTNDTEEGRASNRRVEFTVLKK